LNIPLTGIFHVFTFCAVVQCCVVCRCLVQLYARCSSMTKHKRNLAVAGGVISSILLSPVLAALAVGERRWSYSCLTEALYCAVCGICGHVDSSVSAVSLRQLNWTGP